MASCCGFPRSTCDFAPTYHGFVRSVFLHALTIVCVFMQSICKALEINGYFSEMMLRVLVFFTLWTEVPCQTSCPDLHCRPLKRIITCAVVSSDVFVLFSRILPAKLLHMCKMTLFCVEFFTNCALGHSSMTMSSVRSHNLTGLNRTTKKCEGWVW